MVGDTMVSNLAEETESNRAELTQIVALNNRGIAGMKCIAEASPDQLPSLPGDSVSPIVGGFVESKPFNAEIVASKRACGPGSPATRA